MCHNNVFKTINKEKYIIIFHLKMNHSRINFKIYLLFNDKCNILEFSNHLLLCNNKKHIKFLKINKLNANFKGILTNIKTCNQFLNFLQGKLNC